MISIQSNWCDRAQKLPGLEGGLKRANFLPKFSKVLPTPSLKSVRAALAGLKSIFGNDTRGSDKGPIPREPELRRAAASSLRKKVGGPTAQSELIIHATAGVSLTPPGLT